jgi:hypothetical protein
MQEYSNVEVRPLDDQQLKSGSSKSKGQLTIQKDSHEKSYSLTVKEGSTTSVSVSLDESLETIRSGSNAIVISLPKQKYLSYLFQFSNAEGNAV